MTVVTHRLDEDLDLDADADAVPPDGPPAAPLESDTASTGNGRPDPRATMVAAAAVLSTGAAAWLIGSMFHGTWMPRLLAMAGVAVGAGLTWLSVAGSGTRRPVLQTAVIPAAVVAGAVIVSPSATGGTANLPSLVGEALRGGGLLQPPIPFEPGWRFLVVVLFAVTSAAAVGLSMSLRRARLSVLIPMPLLVGAAILQPGDNLLDPAVAGMMAIGGLAIAFGADTPESDGSRARFEIRRLMRGAGLLAVLGAVLVLVARAGFLFPDQPDNRVIPPQRPPSPPAEPDRVIFTAEGDTRGPFRVGVLDGYDGEAFLLPPIDPERTIDIATLTPERTTAAETLTVRFTIEDMRGSTLPVPASPVSIDRTDSLEADPRTQVVRLTSGRPPSGYTYAVTSLVPPSGEQLATAGVVTAPDVLAFAEAPPAPNEVVTALAEAPESGFDRIQFLRQRLYNAVVAAGEGSPDPVPPSRVGEMLRPGAEATPFEITAAEVLLARWAGVPARLGFGFYGGEENGGVTEFRPRHGAAWLEVYFEGYGWVPLVGTPPRAKSSLSDSLKNDSPETTASQDLAMVVFVPVRRTAIELLYQQARYWLAILAPVGLMAGAVMTLWAPVLKLVRRFRRQRWASQAGPRARVWTAYAEFRDRATDLGIGTPAPPPLEFLGVVEPDAEHEELAWLVTRAMWGDLQRDLQDTDADAAEEMARSVTGRLTGAQPFVMRALAMLSKASMREPFAPELPGRRLRARHSRPAANGIAARARYLLARPATAFAALLVVTVALAPVLFPVREASATLPVAMPARVLPDTVGRFTVARESDTEDNFARPGDDSLAVAGRVHTFRADALVAGSHQLVVLADNVDTRDRDTQHRLESNILNGAFTTRWYGTVRIRELHTAEQQVYLWFPPTTNVMQLWVFRADVDDARATVERTIAFQLDLPHRLPGGPE